MAQAGQSIVADNQSLRCTRPGAHHATMSSSFADKLKVLSKAAPLRLPKLETEEATKNALIMPFLGALGYDVFDPSEVVPEFTADVGTKKGEKVDYAIKRGDEVIILIEAKKASESLSTNHSGQLYRYFSVTKARIAILTNGIYYQFFSDLEEPNKMDAKPFLELNILEPKDSLIEELTKLTKDAFDLEDMLSAASDLKYMREIRRAFEEQLEVPDEEFVRFFHSKACPNGRFTQGARIQFAELVKKTLLQVVADRVSSRLRSALAQEDARERSEPVDGAEGVGIEADSGKERVVTTEDELEGYRVVRAIVRRVLDLKRVSYRDTKGYFGILVDNNNRKPLCRLHLNRSQWYVGLFDGERNEQRHPITSIDDIYRFSDELTEAAKRYVDAGDKPAVAAVEVDGVA